MNFIEYNKVAEKHIDSTSNLGKIKKRVAQIKATEGMGVKYMQRWEEEELIRQKAKDEERISSVRNVMNNLKISVEEAMAAIGIPESEYGKYKAML